MMYLIVKHCESYDLPNEGSANLIMNAKSFLDYIHTNGYHFTEKLSDVASERMKNTDGSLHHWHCSDVVRELKNMGIEDYGHCTIGDITYLANMAYADFYPDVLTDEYACIKYAVAVAHDIDGYDGIAFSRWIADLIQKHITDISWEQYI